MNEIALTSSMRQNLINLQGTANNLSTVQNRLASGKKVNTALDDPVNFFAAQANMSRAADLALRKDSMGEAIQTAKAADSAITAISSLLDQAKSIATTSLSTSDTNSRASYSTQFNVVMSQILAVANDASYKGTNFLKAATLTVKFNEDGTSSLAMTGFRGDSIANLTLGMVGTTVTTSYGSSTGVGIWSDATCGGSNIQGALDAINTATTNLRDQAKSIATNLNVITVRSEFAKNMIDTLKTGADNLTLADMNEEGANMLMLQTRQSLGITSLSLASQAAQSVLRMF
ncbi:MAG: flagellin [Nitrospirae bacterium]|nr:flagellin [Nitrospirota bacterium]